MTQGSCMLTAVAARLRANGASSTCNGCPSTS